MGYMLMRHKSIHSLPLAFLLETLVPEPKSTESQYQTGYSCLPLFWSTKKCPSIVYGGLQRPAKSRSPGILELIRNNRFHIVHSHVFWKLWLTFHPWFVVLWTIIDWYVFVVTTMDIWYRPNPHDKRELWTTTTTTTTIPAPVLPAARLTLRRFSSQNSLTIGPIDSIFLVMVIGDKGTAAKTRSTSIAGGTEEKSPATSDSAGKSTT